MVIEKSGRGCNIERDFEGCPDLEEGVVLSAEPEGLHVLVDVACPAGGQGDGRVGRGGLVLLAGEHHVNGRDAQARGTPRHSCSGALAPVQAVLPRLAVSPTAPAPRGACNIRYNSRLLHANRVDAITNMPFDIDREGATRHI